jgi:hypothetical protein
MRPEITVEIGVPDMGFNPQKKTDVRDRKSANERSVPAVPAVQTD